MIGPISRTTENTIAEGSIAFAPNLVKLVRASMERTAPIAAPAIATSGIDFDPTSSSCRMSSRHSYGGVTAAFKTCQEKTPRLPNHSKKSLVNPMAESAFDEMGTASCPGSAGFVLVAAVAPRSLNDLDQGPAPRVNCLDAFSIARSGARYKKTQGRHFHPCRPACCSCQYGIHPWR